MSDPRTHDRDPDGAPDVEREAGARPEAADLARRRFLAAGLTGAPLILTVRARSVWARRRRDTDTTETRGETGEEDSAALSGEPSEAPEA
jgi:hypothetical protein